MIHNPKKTLQKNLTNLHFFEVIYISSHVDQTVCLLTRENVAYRHIPSVPDGNTGKRFSPDTSVYL